MSFTRKSVGYMIGMSFIVSLNSQAQPQPINTPTNPATPTTSKSPRVENTDRIQFNGEDYIKKGDEKTTQKHVLSFYRANDSKSNTQQFITLTYHFNAESEMRQPAKYVDSLMQKAYALPGKKYAIKNWVNGRLGNDAAISIQTINEQSIDYEFKRYVNDTLTPNGLYVFTLKIQFPNLNKAQKKALIDKHDAWLNTLASLNLSPQQFQAYMNAPTSK